MTLKLFFYSAMLLLAILGYRHYASSTKHRLQPGDDAPNFSLPDSDGNMHALHDYAGKFLVIYFYPKDDTPGCTQEACGFRDNISQLEKLGVRVIGISVDGAVSHQRFKEKYHLPFPLLADLDGQISQRYHALTNLIFLKLAKRYTFIVDPTGKIVQTYYAVDSAQHAQQIIADLKKHLQDV